MLKELQTVELAYDMPRQGLLKGTRGTVVHCYRGGKAIEVEFFNKKGNTITVATLAPSDVVATNRSRTTVSSSKARRVPMGGNDRTVYRREDGQWVNKKQGATKASSVHKTQREAEAAARQMLRNSGGGELTTKGRDGKIRSKDTIGRRDPNPPRDREH